MLREKFDITGMTCSACSSHIETKTNKLEGVAEAKVNLLSNTMSVLYNEKLIDNDSIILAVQSLGYGASVHKQGVESYKQKADSKLKSLIVSVALLIVLMIFGMGHMYSLNINVYINAAIQATLTLGIIIINSGYFSRGFKGLFTLSPNMDTLIALGATASVLYSVSAIIFVPDFIHSLYFESAGMILTFVSIGKYFESRSKSRTTEAISKLLELSPDTALIERNGKEELISTADVRVSDIVIIKTSNRIPVDGTVIFGDGTADESSLTGESMPVTKSLGDTLMCGTSLTSGYVKMRADKIGSDTALSKIISLVEEASSSKAPIAKVADKVSRYFVPVVIALSILTCVIWNSVGVGFSAALSFAIAVLVISCPCALGLATPTAIMVGTGKAAQYGILIKSSEKLEILSKTKNVVFDKTGTITQGKPSVTDIITYDGTDKSELLKIAASLEHQSDHPLASAIIKEHGELPYYSVSEYESITGKGISGVINGTHYNIGNKDFIGLEITDSTINSISKKGATPLFVSDSERLLGIICVSDKIKDSSIDAINGLRHLGINTYMLTGDNEITAEYVRSKTNIDKVFAQLMPDEKERIVKELKQSGTTVMVGDGINDGPALVSADIGMAIGAGTDIAIDCADIILMKNNLSDVLTAIELSRSVLKNIKENLFWAFIYNCFFIPIAAGALYLPFSIRLSPMYATIAMSLSSVCVVSNALRLKRFKPKFINSNSKPKENKVMKTIVIDGMMCEHCKKRVEDALNAIDNVSATVELEKKSAFISGEADNETLTKAVTDAGYTVISIK